MFERFFIVMSRAQFLSIKSNNVGDWTDSPIHCDCTCLLMRRLVSSEAFAALVVALRHRSQLQSLDLSSNQASERRLFYFHVYLTYMSAL